MSTPTTSDTLSPEVALAPVALRSAYELVAERLRRGIHLGAFGPGERLPPERELAARLGVSRVTLREALRVLQGEGYIVTRRGAAGGPEVAVPSPERVRESLRSRLPELEELVAYREVVETGAARLAAAHRTEADLEALEAAVVEVRGAEGAGAFRRADARFHLALAGAAGNDLLAGAIADARERMFAPTDVLPFRVMRERTATEHAAILAAVRGRRSDAAGRRMAEHIASARQQLLDVLG